MTYQQQIDKINALLPSGERYSRWYSAFEGGIRVISIDGNNIERRYNAVMEKETGDILSLERY